MGKKVGGVGSLLVIGVLLEKLLGFGNCFFKALEAEGALNQVKLGELSQAPIGVSLLHLLKPGNCGLVLAELLAATAEEVERIFGGNISLVLEQFDYFLVALEVVQAPAQFDHAAVCEGAQGVGIELLPVVANGFFVVTCGKGDIRKLRERFLDHLGCHAIVFDQ